MPINLGQVIAERAATKVEQGIKSAIREAADEHLPPVATAIGAAAGAWVLLKGYQLANKHEAYARLKRIERKLEQGLIQYANDNARGGEMPKRKLDFSGVSEDIRSGGRSKHIPEGDYLLKIMEGTWEEGSKADYIRWRFQVAQGKHKGVTLYANTSLSQKALWNLRNLIHAAVGRNVAGKAVNFDPESLTGKIVGASVEDNEYNDRLYSTPVDFFSRDKFEASASEEAEDSDTEDEEEETEEEDEDELEDVDVEDL